MSVRTTPTASDANLERKKIQDEIALLKQTRDTTRRECEQWASAKEAIRCELEAKTGLILSTEEYDAILSLDLKKQRDDLVVTLNTLNSSIEEKTRIENTLTASIEALESREAILITNVENLKKDEDLHKRSAGAARADHSDASVKKLTELGELDRQIGTARAMLDTITAEQDEKRPWILQEEARLARKASDLAIYETRIRKMAVAAGLDPVTIVINE